MPSAIVTGLILSVWASVPYLILLPIARREGRLLFTIIAVLVILGFGMFSMDRGRHTPGDDGAVEDLPRVAEREPCIHKGGNAIEAVLPLAGT
jgi:hypothetical protein